MAAARLRSGLRASTIRSPWSMSMSTWWLPQRSRRQRRSTRAARARYSTCGTSSVAVLLLIAANVLVLALVFGMAFLLLLSMGAPVPLAIGCAALFVGAITAGPALTLLRRR